MKPAISGEQAGAKVGTWRLLWLGDEPRLREASPSSAPGLLLCEALLPAEGEPRALTGLLPALSPAAAAGKLPLPSVSAAQNS
jgi:hypothetical protein